MKTLRASIILAGSAIAVAAFSYSVLSNNRVPVDFFKGHTHVDGVTHGAPSHSGGTNSQGCHNASVPYHCH